MKRQNKIITLFAVAAVAATVGSCSKSFLEKTPQSSLTTGNFYKTAKDAEGALIGAYDALQQEYYIWDYQTNGDTRADNTYAGGDNPTNFQIDKFQVNAINGNVERDWNQLYNGIMRANAVLDNVPNITDPVWTTDERKNQILGEAKFLRALHYFHIVRNWGDVPLVLTMNDADIFKTRTPAADVYAQIEKDLKEAEAVLPETYSSPEQTRGRATKGGAQALLAKVYAQQLKYAECLEYCNKVLANTNYSLLPDYAQLFDGAHENSSEAIFEIQYHSDGEGDWGIQLITPESLTGDQWKKFNVPSHDLIQKMRAQGDSTRLHASVIFEFVTARPDEYPENFGDPVPFIGKWKHPDGWNSPDNVIFIRLADIMLLKAEALNETSQTAQAIPIINTIRDRVDLPPTTATTQAQVREAILNERRFELAFEGERWYDLLRAGAQYTITTMNALKGAGGNNLNYNVTQQKLLFPIPQTERDLNKNLSQNDGY
jgi:hypothetical protein